MLEHTFAQLFGKICVGKKRGEAGENNETPLILKFGPVKFCLVSACMRFFSYLACFASRMSVRETIPSSFPLICHRKVMTSILCHLSDPTMALYHVCWKIAKSEAIERSGFNQTMQTPRSIPWSCLVVRHDLPARMEGPTRQWCWQIPAEEC